jgi:hypothetical protein
LYINHKGFLISDACVSVLIVVICSLIVSSVLTVHHSTAALIQNKESELEERIEMIMEESEKCSACSVDLH